MAMMVNKPIYYLFVLRKDSKQVGYEMHKYIPDPVNDDRSSVFIYHSKTGHPMSWRSISMNDDEKSFIFHNEKELIAENIDEDTLRGAVSFKTE